MSAVIHKGRTIEQLRAHCERTLKPHRAGNPNLKVKFSRSMWDRILREQHEFAGLSQVGIDGKPVKHK